MVSKNLEELVKDSITDIKSGKIDKRIVSFTDYKNKYSILKSKITVKIELKEGIVAELDVSDFFEKEIC